MSDAPLTMIGVSGWMFLLVQAHPVGPGQNLFVCVLLVGNGFLFLKACITCFKSFAFIIRGSQLTLSGILQQLTIYVVVFNIFLFWHNFRYRILVEAAMVLVVTVSRGLRDKWCVYWQHVPVQIDSQHFLQWRMISGSSFRAIRYAYLLVVTSPQYGCKVLWSLCLFVHLSACVTRYLCGRTSPNFLTHFACGRGSVLLW